MTVCWTDKLADTLNTTLRCSAAACIVKLGNKATSLWQAPQTADQALRTARTHMGMAAYALDQRRLLPQRMQP